MISTVSTGIILIIFGLIVLLKALFGIDIPLFRIIFGCGLVYYGINLITHVGITIPQNNYQETTRFASSTIRLSGYGPLKKEYNTIFGHLKLLIDDNIILEKGRYTKIRTVFGKTEIRIPRHISAQVNVASMFGSTHVLDFAPLSFGGKTLYIGPSAQMPDLIIDVDTIFGSCTIKNSE